MNYTVKNISKIFDVKFFGDENFYIDQVSSIECATERSIVFLSDKKYLKLLNRTKSKVVITTEEFAEFCNNNVIISKNPYLLFAKISQSDGVSITPAIFGGNDVEEDGKVIKRIYNMHGPLFFASAQKFVTFFNPKTDPELIEIHFLEQGAILDDFSAIHALNVVGEKYGKYDKSSDS